MTVLVDEQYYKGVAGMLYALPERVIRFRLPDLTVTYCNVAWAAGHHLEPPQVIGRKLDELLTAAERSTVLQWCREVASADARVDEHESGLLTRLSGALAQ